MLIEESELLGLWVSYVKMKKHIFLDILDAAILSVPVCGEDVEVTERFTYLGSDIHVSPSCEPAVNRHLGLTWESWIHWFMWCGAVIPLQEDESPSLQVHFASSLALRM